jgi:hypothetical protein
MAEGAWNGTCGPERVAVPPRRAGPASGRLSILILDDDPLRHAAFALQGRGHAIDHCWFVDDAVRRLGSRVYDLVCLDNDLETEGLRREGREVARHIAGLPAEARPRAVLVHSWNAEAAVEMETTLRHAYRPGVTLLRSEFGAFHLVGPGPACAGEADLRRWVVRAQTLEPNPLASLVDGRPPRGLAL